MMQWEKIDIEGLAERAGKTTHAIRGYLKKGILIWHEKDDKTGIKNIFYAQCSDVRLHFIKLLRDNGKTQAEMAGLFEATFGKKDEVLRQAFNGVGRTVEEVIDVFRKSLTEKGMLST